MGTVIRRSTVFLVVAIMGLGLFSFYAWPYEVNTHRDISKHAFELAELKAFLASELGLSGEEKFDLEFTGKRTASGWVIEGSKDEDEHARYIHHFYDPVYNRGLNKGQLGRPSHEWGLETNGEISGQVWSYRDARQYYLLSLKEPDPKTRERNLGKTFYALGHVIHLIQDLASPPHTRDDLHSGLGKRTICVENVCEEVDLGPLSVVEKFLDRPPVRARLNFSGYPIPGLEQGFRKPLDFWVETNEFGVPRSADPNTKGLSQIINRGFVSEGTNFTEFKDGNHAKDYPQPVLKTNDCYDEQTTAIDAEGRAFSGLVKFCRNSFVDSLLEPLGDSGIPLKTNPRMTSFSALSPNLSPNPDLAFPPGFSLNSKNAESIGQLTIPRATSFSAGLMKYFFRGKLDVDLVEADPADPSVVQVSGTNASEETLDGGTLTLYADVPATPPAQGMVRKEAPAVEPNDPRLTVTAKKGEPVVSAAFRLPGEAERFVAVYKGKLGNEVPQGDFPGAVIGKALGGVRVESIYPDGEKRMLRTVDKIFPMPSTADRLERVQWGALDNTFVGTVSDSSTSDAPDKVVAFKINRPVGSSEVPVVAAPEGSQVVVADVLKKVEFPYDLSVGVTQNWSTTYNHKQFLLTYDLNDTYVWNDTDPDPSNHFYQFDSREVGSPTSEVVVTEPITFSGSFSVVLDRGHRVGGEAFTHTFTPYTWRVQDLAVDAQGRLLVLVRVDQTQPHGAPERRPRQFKKRNAQGQLVDDPSFGQMEILLVQEDFQLVQAWALLEVGESGGTVLGVTAKPTVSEALEFDTPIVTFQPHVISTFKRGPKDGQREETWEPLHLRRFPFPPGEFTTMDRGSVNLGRVEARGRTVGGLREELASLVPDPGIPSSDVQLGATDPVAYYVDNEAKTSHAIWVLSTVLGGGSGVSLREVRLLRPTPGAPPEALALFSHQVFSVLGEITENQSPLVRWSPETPAATVLATPALPPPHFYDRMRKTTSQAALFRVFDADTFERSALLVDLRAKTTQSVSADALEPEYVLLEPKYLYNVNDLRFHRLDALLPPTVLPRRLAPIPAIAPPGAAYHVIPLP